MYKGRVEKHIIDVDAYTLLHHTHHKPSPPTLCLSDSDDEVKILAIRRHDNQQLAKRIFTIESDSEAPPPQMMKRLRRDPSSDVNQPPNCIDRISFTTSYWDHIHAGLELSDTSFTVWKPFSRSEKDTDVEDLEQAIGDLSVKLFAEEQVEKLNDSAIMEAQSLISLRPDMNTDWTKFIDCCATAMLTKKSIGMQNTVHSLLRASQQHLAHQNLYSCMHRRKSFVRHTSGCIMSIAQSSSCIAVGSVVPDIDIGSSNPFKDHNLMIYYGDDFVPIQGHHSYGSLGPSNQANVSTYYTVNAVKFDPLCPEILASAGSDHRIQIWDISDLRYGARKLAWEWVYADCPIDIEYKPCTSTLAAICNKSIHVHSTAELKDFNSDVKPTRLDIKMCRATEQIGKVLWNHTPGTNHLFFSTETLDLSSGSHCAFDVERDQIMWTFAGINDECGDHMALQRTGPCLALLTQTRNSGYPGHFLRLYDVARGNHEPLVTLKLGTFLQHPGEVTCTAFSSDGIYLGIGKDDDSVDIFDTRFFRDMHPVVSLWHELGRGYENYGIVDLEWVQRDEGLFNTGIGLVTGGSDGAVRLWDISSTSGSPSDSTVLMNLNYDVARFCVGKIRDGERRLAV